ncbi:retrovirus-related pol polyprotein from transposon TNT 1-94 [Tanacetum coccineum]
MEQAVEQHRLESRTFEVKMNQVLSENERLLAQAIDKDIVKDSVRLSTSASGSQPSGNTKNDRILQTPSSNSKNKVEAHPRNVKSSCIKGNGTVNDKGSAEWACPLTRITTTNEVPSRQPIALDSESPKPVVKLVYSRKPRKNKNTEPVSKTKVLQPMSANKQEPSKSWGSTKTNIPSTSLNECRLSKSSSETDKGTEFCNQTLREYYEKVDISHETSVARSPQQQRVVERRNRTLIEAARTMLIYAKAPLFLWAEAVATACYTQNRSMIRRRHGKTPYELLHNKPPDLSRTRQIIETIHVDFDELTAMASEHSCLGPALHEMTPATNCSGLVPNPPSSTPFVPPSRSD